MKLLEILERKKIENLKKWVEQIWRVFADLPKFNFDVDLSIQKSKSNCGKRVRSMIDLYLHYFIFPIFSQIDGKRSVTRITPRRAFQSLQTFQTLINPTFGTIFDKIPICQNTNPKCLWNPEWNNTLIPRQIGGDNLIYKLLARNYSHWTYIRVCFWKRSISKTITNDRQFTGRKFWGLCFQYIFIKTLINY